MARLHQRVSGFSTFAFISQIPGAGSAMFCFVLLFSVVVLSYLEAGLGVASFIRLISGLGKGISKLGSGTYPRLEVQSGGISAGLQWILAVAFAWACFTVSLAYQCRNVVVVVVALVLVCDAPLKGVAR